MNKKLNRLWRQITADKKRFGIMLSLVCVGLLLWGRLILLEDVPRVATAEPDTEEQTEQPPARAVRDRPRVALDLPDALAMDLFELRPNRYTLIEVTDLEDEGLESGHGPTDEWLVREALMDDARQMTLQGVVRSDPPFAIIDEVRVYIGDTHEGFVLTGLNYHERKARLRSETFEDLVVILRISNG